MVIVEFARCRGIFDGISKGTCFRVMLWCSHVESWSPLVWWSVKWESTTMICL
jgi:hypothetical protein